MLKISFQTQFFIQKQDSVCLTILTDLKVLNGKKKINQIFPK